MRLVLIGDLHFYKLGVWPWQLLGKRLFGQLNLLLRRRRVFRMERWPRIVERVRELKPGYLLFAGDLVTTALPGEFAMAREALRPLLSEFPAVIVPGNHDRHSFRSARLRMLEQAFPGVVPARFPHHVELSKRLHLVALDPTRANVISDKGRLGERQVNEARTILKGVAADGCRAVVLCHYTLGTPPGVHREAGRHRMIDEAGLREVLARSGIDVLYLHGHVHEPWVWRVNGAPNVVAVNAGAPMMHDDRHPHGQGIVSVEAQVGEGGWELVRHVMNRDGGWEERRIDVPQRMTNA